MSKATLSIFVDESGRFKLPDIESPYYIVSLVLHDQRTQIDQFVLELDRCFAEMRLSNVCFHAGPLIRQKNAFAIMDWSFRVKIFRRMLAFAHKLPFQYHCLVVEKRYVNTLDQLIEELKEQLSSFIEHLSLESSDFSRIKIYYDCGQTPVTNILLPTFNPRAGMDISFAQAVRPERYKLFQIADMIATLKLVETKLDHGTAMTESEYKFFGGPSNIAIFMLSWACCRLPYIHPLPFSIVMCLLLLIPRAPFVLTTGDTAHPLLPPSPSTYPLFVARPQFLYFCTFSSQSEFSCFRDFFAVISLFRDFLLPFATQICYNTHINWGKVCPERASSK